MRRSARSAALTIGIVGALAGPTFAADRPRMFWVPRGGDPTDYSEGATVIYAVPGGRVCAELYLQSVDYAATGVEAAHASIPDRVASDSTGEVRADCSSARIDTGRADSLGFNTN